MRKTILFMFLILSMLLTACSSGAATPTDPPTAVPPTQKPAEPTTPPAQITSADIDTLTANPWKWIGFTDPTQQYTVENPEDYTLTFQVDGTVNIKADCNNAMGSYTVDGSSIKIEIGPMTRAQCMPESRSDEFLKYLGFAAIYFFKDGNLFIDLMADGGTLEFAPVTLTSNSWQWVSYTGAVEQFQVEVPEIYLLSFNADGTLNIKADCNNAGGSYTSEAKNLAISIGPMTMAACPEGSRSEQFVKLLGGAAKYFFADGKLFIDLMVDGGTLQFAPIFLTATPWQWVSFAGATEQFQVEAPENYLLTFHGDGTLDIKADCNNASGTYTSDSSSLTIQIGPMTMAACPEGSRSDDYIKYLGFAAGYFFEGSDLFIDLYADGGTMKFSP